MGKIKVYELAKELGLPNNEVIEKLASIGVEVKSHLSSIDDGVAGKIKNVKISSSIKKEEKIQKDKKIETSAKQDKIDAKKSEEAKAQMHIIRRKVKVINTDGEKSEVEQITTNISGAIKKSHTVVDGSNADTTYSKEGLGVITPRQPNHTQKPININRRTSNVVVTRNGKPLDSTKPEESVNKNIELHEENKDIADKEVLKDTDKKESKSPSSVQSTRNNAYNDNRNQDGNNGYRGQNQTTGSYNGGRSYNNNNSNRPATQTGGYNRPYNNQNPNPNGQSRPYNNRPYNNQNSNTQGQNNTGYNNRPYNNNRPQSSQAGNQTGGYNRPYNRPYNNQNSNTQSQNNGGYNNRQSNNFNTSGNGYQNNGYRNNNNNNGGYNNNSGGGYNNRPNNNNNTSYQVNKFIKQAATQPVEQKETRDYNSNPDKKKFTKPLTVNEKKDRLDKNKLREERSRVSTTKLKGLEVNTSTGLMDLYEREGDYSRKNGYRKRNQRQKPILNQTKIIPMTEVKLPEIMSVKEFAESIKKQASDVIKKLFGLGIMATVNQEIDFDTAYLIAAEFGITAEKQVVVTDEDILFDESEDEEKNLESRDPIVVVMGHVDHGKTSLLDRIRSADVVAGEAGGITQHIGAYKVKCNSRKICFLDTPGHEAFTAMRARGAQVTDIAIIVVAADDGIKPQTIEAIDHAKAAGVSIIVAINKIDKQTADVDKVKQELLQIGLVAEEWGGDTVCIPISAATGEGIDNLLEMILLVADMKDLKANPNKQAKGTILESRLDKSIGTVASLLVQRGTLSVGDTIVVGDIVGRVRAMKNDKGQKVMEAGPSTPVEIIGLPKVPHTGDVFYEVENDKVAKHLVDKRKAKTRRELIKQGSKVTLDDLFGQIKEGKIKDLNVIIKADVQGSVEALKESLEKLSNDEVRVRVLHASTGGIKESDVTLASVSNALIIGFNVRPESMVQLSVDKAKVDLRLYSVIYDAIDDVETALKGLMPKKYKEMFYGTCEIRKIFNITGAGIIAGCYVTKGKILRGAMVRIVRDSIVVFEIKIDSLKREKEDVKEVAEGYECGIKLEKFSDIKIGDIFECFEMVEEKRV
ncbi:MAG: translation initiation factor IF-2 [Clostridia bacterium]